MKKQPQRPLEFLWRPPRHGRCYARSRGWCIELVEAPNIPALMASSTLWIGITFLAVLAGIRRRARARRVREQWAREEDTEEIG